MHKLLLCLMFFALVASGAGCMWVPPPRYSNTRDKAVPSKPIHWVTDFIPGQVYELQKSMILVRDRAYVADYNIVRIGDYSNSHYGAPQYLDEYLRKGPKAWPKTIAILKPGTLIRYEETRKYDGGVVFGSMGVPVGRFVSDEFNDVGPICMIRLSKPRSSHPTNAQDVDPEYLKPLDEVPPGSRIRITPADDEPVNWCTDYVPGQIYELQNRRAVVLRKKTPFGIEYIIDYRHPLTSAVADPAMLEEYRRVGSKAWKWRKVVALLEVGTQLRYEETRSYHGGPITLDSLGIPIAHLVGDEYDEIGPIDISIISECSNYSRPGALAYDVDPYYLKPIRE